MLHFIGLDPPRWKVYCKNHIIIQNYICAMSCFVIKLLIEEVLLLLTILSSCVDISFRHYFETTSSRMVESFSKQKRWWESSKTSVDESLFFRKVENYLPSTLLKKDSATVIVKIYLFKTTAHINLNIK